MWQGTAEAWGYYSSFFLFMEALGEIAKKALSLAPAMSPKILVVTDRNIWVTNCLMIIIS
jgi:hypothetical protein